MPSQQSPPQQPQLSVLTFNLLAPCYKRLFSPSGQERSDREQHHSQLWNDRLDKILSLLDSVSPAPDVIALQELWFHPPFLTRLKDALSSRYHVFTAKRPSPKNDGLATLIRKNHPLLTHPTCHAVFQLSNSDRIALAVTIDLPDPSKPHSHHKLLVVNTHLTFPHDHFLRRVQDTQARALTAFVNSFVNSCPSTVSTLVLGDFNSDKRSTVCNRMHDAGFLNCYLALNGPTACPTTHYNHNRQQVFVDHVFLRTDPYPSQPIVPQQSNSPSEPSTPTSKSTSARSRSSSPSSIGAPNVFDFGPHHFEPIQTHSTTRPSLAPNRLKPIDSAVYPKELPNEQWPSSFQISDHRPVGISFSLDMTETL